MALQAGLRVIHIDVDRRTLHMDPRLLDACLSEQTLSETILLVDHTFGYPDAGIDECRRAYPDLLIVEDCVRALGGEIDGRPVGSSGDWALFSMYKTTRGNDDGAILMTRSPYLMPSARATRPSLRQWASGNPPLRRLNGFFKRRQPGMQPATRRSNVPHWTAAAGLPNWLVRRRFEHQLGELAETRERHQRAGDEIRAALDDARHLRFIDVTVGCRTSAFFLSFTLSSQPLRDSLVASMHRQGYFLVWAWNSVPAFYQCFADTFPFGFSESVYLADHVCHIPLVDYAATTRRHRLVTSLRKALDDA